MSVLSAERTRDFEIHRYPVLVYALVPVLAVVLQAWLPRLLGRFAWFDLPLVITVFFALNRRSLRSMESAACPTLRMRSFACRHLPRRNSTSAKSAIKKPKAKSVSIRDTSLAILRLPPTGKHSNPLPVQECDAALARGCFHPHTRA